MNASPTDQEISELLPWYVNDTLPESLRVMVMRHMAQSSMCRAEARWLANLRSRVQSESGARSSAVRTPAQIDNGLQKLIQRIAAHT